MKYFGETWPTGAQAGGPAITTQPPVRDRAERLVAYEVFKPDQAATAVIVAVPEPERAE